MNIDFTDKRVLVSGSTGGIGFAAAKGFLAAGASVVVNGRSNASVEAAVARLREVGAEVAGFAGDLGTAEACARLGRTPSRPRHRRQQHRRLRAPRLLRDA